MRSEKCLLVLVPCKSLAILIRVLCSSGDKPDWRGFSCKEVKTVCPDNMVEWGGGN